MKLLLVIFLVLIWSSLLIAPLMAADKPVGPQLSDASKLAIRDAQIELQNFVITNEVVLSQWMQLQAKVQQIVNTKLADLKLKPEDYDLDATLQLVPKAKPAEKAEAKK